ncbi:flagellar basal-body MS-ring/collar protein FliF [Campylobacter troglodytis]|uniref:flagellar basal-body MS-ring/collar protein FliF n=1 Tax=Campylobacter troglodytis TaxID=654363 RepID=UPI001159BF99|nr:flagellar basal-body MS-ring/collar protein FliF [Campylobacter troglodytis]TQR60959.1 flagellar M-ring protein FliF [Campylobacter troglodytis]
MEEFKSMLHQIGLLYQKLTKKQRIVIGVSIVAVIAFLVFLALFRGGSSTTAGYGVLVEDAGATNAAAIVAKLEQNGVPYQLRNERTILVPQDQVYRQRMMIASEGLIKDSRVGYEIFDIQQFGATKADEKIRQLRALQGELSRAIEALEPIQRAIINIAIPDETVFTERQVPPTAAVVLTIREGLRLTRKQIDGIKNIVSAAVPKLSLDNVRITDQNGIRLDDEELFESDLIAAQVKYKRDHETELEQKIINTLAPFAGGVDKVVASVNIEFDFSKMQSQSEIYDPNTVIRSEQTLNEESQGRREQSIQGVPGAVSNIGPVEGLDGPNALEYSKKNQVTTNNEISKTITNTQKSFATIIRTAAAVMIDGKYQESLDADGNPQVEYIPLTVEQLQSVENLVQRTINFNAARGDVVTVSNLEFQRKDALVESKVKTFYERFVNPFIPPAKYIIAAILLFIFYKKVIQPFMQKMLADLAESEEELQKEAEAIEDVEDTLEKFNAARKRVEDQLGIGDSIDEDALQYDILIEKLRALVSERTTEVAALLQTLVEHDADYEANKEA